MINQDLLFYIKDQLASGADPKLIQKVLLEHGGWKKSDIDEALAFIVTKDPKPKVFPIERTRTTPSLQSEQVHHFPLSAPTHVPDAPVLVNSSTAVKTFHKKRKTTRRRIFFVVFSFLCLTIGAGIYVYAVYVSPSKSRVIGMEKTAWASVHSFSFSLVATTHFFETMKTPWGDAKDLSFAFAGGMDTALPAVTAMLSTKIDTVATPSVLELFFQNNLFYAKGASDFFTRIPKTDATIEPAQDVTVSVSAHELPGILGIYFNNDAAILSHATLMANTLSPELFGRIQQTLVSDPGFVISGDLPKETIDGQSMRHYSFSSDRIALANLFEEFVLAFESKPPTSTESEKIDFFLNQLSISGGEVWIGVRDTLPHKIVLNVTTPGSAELPHSETTLTLSLSQFNAPVTVTAPDGARPLFDILKEIKNAETIGQIKSVLDAINPRAAIYYSKKRSYTGFCGSLGATSFGADIQKISGTGESYCNDGITNYAYVVPATLIDATAPTYYCIDHDSVTIETVTAPNDFICKSEVSIKK